MSNFSVSRPPRALIFRAGREKKTFLSLPFFKFWVRQEAAPRNSHSLFNFSRRREEGVNKNCLSISSSSSLFKPIPKTDNADSKNQQKIAFLWKSWRWKFACVGIRVGMFTLRALFFVFARAHRFAHWTRTRNRENNHCALLTNPAVVHSPGNFRFSITSAGGVLTSNEFCTSNKLPTCRWSTENLKWKVEIVLSMAYQPPDFRVVLCRGRGVRGPPPGKCFHLRGDNPSSWLDCWEMHISTIWEDFLLKFSAMIAIMHRFPCRKFELHQACCSMHFSQNQLGQSARAIAHFCYMFFQGKRSQSWTNSIATSTMARESA